MRNSTHLHIRMSRTTFTPLDYEQVRKCLLDKKATQKKYHDQTHDVKPLPELKAGQKVLFLSLKEQNQYNEGTVTTKTSTPRSYYVGSKGKTYHLTCQYIHTINTDLPVLQGCQQEHFLVTQHHQQSMAHISQDH